MIVLRPDPHDSAAFQLMEKAAVVGFISIAKERRATRADWGLIWSSGVNRGTANDLSGAWQAASRNWERWKDWTLGAESVDADLDWRSDDAAGYSLFYRNEKVGAAALQGDGARWILGDPIIGIAGEGATIVAARADANAAWRDFWSRAGRRNEAL